MKRRIVFICLCSLLCITVLYYVIMVMPTNNIIHFAKLVFTQEINKESYKDNALVEYYFFPIDIRENIVNIDIKRLFVLHDSKHGYRLVRYTYLVTDRDTGLTITASKGVNSKWIIDNIDGEWVVSSIEENP